MHEMFFKKDYIYIYIYIYIKKTNKYMLFLRK